MIHKRKPYKKNTKLKNTIRGQKAARVIMDCTEGCKYYPKECGNCPYDKENDNE